MTVVLQSCAAIGHIIAEPAHGIGAEIEMSHATGFAAGSTMRQVLSQTVHHEAQANTHIEQPIAANVITDNGVRRESGDVAGISLRCHSRPRKGYRG
jgi:hypothetical protein